MSEAPRQDMSKAPRQDMPKPPEHSTGEVDAQVDAKICEAMVDEKLHQPMPELLSAAVHGECSEAVRSMPVTAEDKTEADDWAMEVEVTHYDGSQTAQTHPPVRHRAVKKRRPSPAQKARALAKQRAAEHADQGDEPCRAPAEHPSRAASRGS